MTTLHTVLSTAQPTTLAIIGLAKNTGKTTTLNACIKTLSNDMHIALTSIGLDGEPIDQLTFLPKPQITVKKGMIIATAEDTLKDTLIKYSLIKRTTCSTALGNIVIIKITHPGNVVIAGPSTNKDLSTIITTLKPLSDIILVDGAFNRKTVASIPSLDGVILATGASLHPDMATTIKATQAIVKSFQYPQTGLDLSTLKSGDPLTITTNKHNTPKVIGHVLTPANEAGNKTLYIKGAITKRIIDYFINHKEKNVTLVIDNATKLLLPTHYFTYIKKLNIRIEVLNTIPLLCVTINPFRPTGQGYDKVAFHSAMQDAISVPVINVQEEEGNR